VKELLRRFRHPLHWLCGFIAGGCLFAPETSKAIAAMLLAFISFGIYEYWEDTDIGDQGWMDWWEFLTAYYLVLVAWLILK